MSMYYLIKAYAEENGLTENQVKEEISKGWIDGALRSNVMLDLLASSISSSIASDIVKYPPLGRSCPLPF